MVDRSLTKDSSTITAKATQAQQGGGNIERHGNSTRSTARRLLWQQGDDKAIASWRRQGESDSETEIYTYTSTDAK
jgi:hypothetical protein